MIKDVPYFPFYAANIMSNRAFRLMSLKERGLFITLLMECWINGSIPSEFVDMSKILGFTFDEVKSAYTNLHSAFFHQQGGQIISHELEGYRKGYLETREKQRLGGIKGAKQKKDKEKGGGKGIPEGQPKGSLVQVNSNSVNLNQLLNKELQSKEIQSWIDDYDRAPEAISYFKASRG
ncbi:DUF1376 domain-containing protein [Polynucleobacter sp. MWH-HuK1]|uniref:DUF1376 domain-containing protein n=1 Tax=Polynucleobacter sp. MWH-HuK1 TaxID=1743158 RepID=UPI001C0C4B03|nr:DUF1376 domain-containing protein [Polynucleobacter sp. MWH-HuK1]MBU3565060.1 DUF1376 domain-containing protein [Polynucleobacter sp. MWH-HuK1]